MIDYAAATAFLDARIGLGVRPGLERIVALLDTMADPHLAVPTIHVAGTNGKTSVARYAASTLAAHGLNVGTFTSPHLEAIEQRYGINGVDLTAAEFTEVVDEVAPIIELFEERSGTGITYFEATAALAFSLFAGSPVDVAVVEVGLGGRLDATNVVEPEVAVITTIGRDHMSYLGDTNEAIAAEKAAIIKEGSVAVTGELDPDAERQVAARTAEVGAERLRYGKEFSVASAIAAVGGWTVDIEGAYGAYHDIDLRAHGRHQVDNFAVAVAAMEAFTGRPLDASAVAAGGRIATPGRMEVLDTAPLVMIDGAHNRPAAAALAAALEREFPSTVWTMVFGAMADKEVEAMLSAIAPRVGRAIMVAADSPRAATPDELMVQAAGSGIVASASPSVGAGLWEAIDDAGDNGAVLVTGSLYVVGEARRAFLDGR